MKIQENPKKFKIFLTSPSVLSYEKAQNMISKHTQNFEKSSEFSLNIWDISMTIYRVAI